MAINYLFAFFATEKNEKLVMALKIGQLEVN